MHADFSVELGRDDAALELPWNSADPAVRYYDLKKHPELLREIPEAAAHPELGAFLTRINAADFPLATAKCDAWASREVAPEEEIFGDRKFVSYVDLVFEDDVARGSFEKHEAFAKALCRLLSQTPEIPAAVEVVIRRCYFHRDGASPEGAASEAEDGGGADAEGESRAGDRAEVGLEAEPAGRAGNEDAVEVELEGEGGNGVDDDAVEVEFEAESGAGAGDDAVEVESEAEGGAGAGETPAEDIHLMDLASDPRGLVGGFCYTAYVTGFGDSDHEPRLRWQIALALLQNALVQLAR